MRSSVLELLLLIFCCRLFFFKQKTAYEIEYGLVGSEMCIRDRLLPVLVIAVLIVGWEIGVRIAGTPRWFLPKPSDIVREMIESRALLWRHTVTTLQEMLVGLALAFVLGITLAIATVGSRLVERAASPLGVARRAVPSPRLRPALLGRVGLGGISNGTQPLHLTDKGEQARAVGRQVAQHPRKRGRLGLDSGQQRLFITAYRSRHRLTQGTQRQPTGNHHRDLIRQVVPKPTFLDQRQHAGATDRRLANTRVSGHDHERLGAQAIDQGADLGLPTEKQRAGLRPEGHSSAP